MSSTPYVILALCTAFSMAFGQLLFKLGAARLHGTTILEYGYSFFKNIHLLLAVTLYAATILVWIYVLKHLPLSKAYPLTALSYLIVPVLGFLILKEPISMKVIVGSLIILVGVFVTHLE